MPSTYANNSFRYEAKLVWNSLTNETRIMTYVYQLKNYVNIYFWRKSVNVVHAMCCLTTFFFSAALMLFIIYIFAFYMCLYS
jgi:hypothetical protein